MKFQRAGAKEIELDQRMQLDQEWPTVRAALNAAFAVCDEVTVARYRCPDGHDEFEVFPASEAASGISLCGTCFGPMPGPPEREETWLLSEWAAQL